MIPRELHLLIQELFRYRFTLERLVHRDIASYVGISKADYLAFALKPFYISLLLTFLKNSGHDNSILAFISNTVNMCVWWFFVDSIKASLNIYKRNRSILNKIYIPKSVFVFSSSLARMIPNELIAISITLLCICLSTYSKSYSFLIVVQFLCILFLISIFTASFALLSSVLAFKSRIYRTSTEYILFSSFFLMPVLLDTSRLGPFQQLYFFLNPVGSTMYIINLLLHDNPNIFNLTFPLYLYVFLWSIISFLCSSIIFYKNINSIADTL